MLSVRALGVLGRTVCVARPTAVPVVTKRGFRGRDFLDEIHVWRDKVIKLANPSIGMREGAIDPWKASVSEKDEPDRGENRPEPVVEALKAGSLGFGFSAGGMLFPYYIGVVEALEELGIMTGKLCETHILTCCLYLLPVPAACFPDTILVTLVQRTPRLEVLLLGRS